MDLHFFDPRETAAILYRKLPHWSQAGVVCFITFRLHDSMPAAVLDRWHADRNAWLRAHQIDPEAIDWRHQLQTLDQKLQHCFHAEFSSRWQDELDTCHGSCVLKSPAMASIVVQSLLKFDQQKYWLTDFVVMPNHVHLLVAFPDDDSLLTQCESWKRYTGRTINAQNGARGRFWQQDGFDHLVRSESQFAWFRKYIADNPRNAGLSPGEFVHFSCDPLKSCACD